MQKMASITTGYFRQFYRLLKRLNEEEKMKIKIQFCFTGINDIKQNKILKAKKVFRESGDHTLAIHFDLYNWKAAFIKLDEIESNDENWITRINLNERLVWNIDQNFFFWDLRNIPPQYQYILENYYT